MVLNSLLAVWETLVVGCLCLPETMEAGSGPDITASSASRAHLQPQNWSWKTGSGLSLQEGEEDLLRGCQEQDPQFLQPEPSHQDLDPMRPWKVMMEDILAGQCLRFPLPRCSLT